MRFRCRISNRVSQQQSAFSPLSARGLRPALRFPTDSKPLSSFVKQYVCRRDLRTTTFLDIGLERAFTEMPANVKLPPPNPPRRDF